ncbi:MAG: efflux RND transporter periplasmic adaptor subunit [Bacteroidia bacterium]|nr:efflux RND transporter periplasmic adaptor subunit [Bacteroidia bacterium]
MRWVQLSSLFLLTMCTPSPGGEEKNAGCLPDSLIETLSLRPASVEAVPVEMRVPGEITSIPDQTTDLRSPVRGTLTEVYVRVGQTTQRGAILLRIRSPELLEWESRYRATRAQIEAQRLRVQALERMAQDSLASRTELSLARAELLSLQAEAERLAEQLQLFRREGADFFLLAPRPGTITRLSVSEGSNVEVGDPLLQIANLERIRLQVYLYPEQLLQAKPGMEGKAYLPGQEEPVNFRLAGFSPVLGEETRAAVGYADVPNEKGLLRPGGFFQARLRLLREDSAVAIPLSALILDADQRYVIVYRTPCRWEIRPVKVLRQTHHTAYIDGITPQETLATQKVLFLYQQLTRTL